MLTVKGGTVNNSTNLRPFSVIHSSANMLAMLGLADRTGLSDKQSREHTETNFHYTLGPLLAGASNDITKANSTLIVATRDFNEIQCPLLCKRGNGKAVAFPVARKEKRHD